MRKFCLVKSISLRNNNNQMLVRGLYGNREFHIPFWSMIYVALKFTLPVSDAEFQFQ